MLVRLGCLLNRGRASRPEIILSLSTQAIPGEESSTVSSFEPKEIPEEYR